MSSVRYPTIKSTVSNLISHNGANKIVDMFTSQAKKQKTKYLSIIREMFQHVEPQLNCQIVMDHKEEICKFINTYFMLCSLENCILIPECQHSVSDRKVIRAIILSFKIYHIDNFINQQTLWRGSNLQNLIQYLRNLKKTVLARELIAERTSSLDLQYLLSTAKVFKENSKNYNYYVNLTQRLKSCEVIQTETLQLFKNFVIKMYEFLGRFQTQKLSLETIKLHLLYLNCILNLSLGKLKLQSPKSRLHYITRWEGFQTLDRYLNDLTLNLIVVDKEHCRFLFTQILDPISEVAQGQSELTNRSQNEKDIKIRINKC